MGWRDRRVKRGRGRRGRGWILGGIASLGCACLFFLDVNHLQT